ARPTPSRIMAHSVRVGTGVGGAPIVAVAVAKLLVGSASGAFGVISAVPVKRVPGTALSGSSAVVLKVKEASAASVTSLTNAPVGCPEWSLPALAETDTGVYPAGSLISAS